MVHSLDFGKPLGVPSTLDDRAAIAVLTAMSEGFPVIAAAAHDPTGYASKQTTSTGRPVQGR